MAFRLVHHDLITVSSSRRRPPGIHWLRLYKDGNEHLAVITNVPGNPGRPATNSIEDIARHILDGFGIEASQLTLFEVWPRGASEGIGPSWKSVTTVSSSRHWTDTTRSAVEGVVGVPLPELPGHDDLYSRVLALGGGRWEDIWRPVFEAFPLAELPPPHNPAKCEHVDRFHQIEEEVKDESGSRELDQIEAGRQFLATLSSADLESCPYHQADWKGIAEESVRILERLGRCDPGEYVDEVDQSRLNETDCFWLATLFSEPIFIGGGSYTNGQHRGCALRFSGADRAAIHVSDELLGTECIDWTYEGDG